MSRPLLTVALGSQRDVVAARQRARQLAQHLHFAPQDQTRIAIAVSEVARQALERSGRGTLEFTLDEEAAGQVLAVSVTDPGGPRPADERQAEEALTAARRLLDRVDVEARGTRGAAVSLRKRLPRGVRLMAGELAEVLERLAREQVEDFADEIRHQNRELLQAMDELRLRHDDLERLRHELEDTNRGVVALYAELDEKAEHLRRADAMKTRFLSNMSHEFRTPLNSILALSRLLQERADGELTPEQERQVGFIVKAARDLADLVDDLLDLAKVEAGKIVVRPAPFELPNVFRALRGMLRPLLVSDAVRLVMDDPAGIPPLYGDEAKVAQILRNLLSNALKFTERGEVRTEARLRGDDVEIVVRDTGIGIAAADLPRIFDEFGQVEHPVQRRVKGTGLGLALSRRLAEVLGGELTVESTLGEGSTFTVRLPLVWRETGAGRERRLLMIDDDEASRYVVRELASQLGFAFEEASDGWDGAQRARREPPSALVLDLVMPGMPGAEVLRRLRAEAATAELPVVVATSKVLLPGEREELEQMGAVVLSKSLFAEPGAAAALGAALLRARGGEG